jgi:hypothetical protein
MESFNQGHFSLWDDQNGCTQPSYCYPWSQFYLKSTLISGFHGISCFKQTRILSLTQPLSLSYSSDTHIYAWAHLPYISPCQFHPNISHSCHPSFIIIVAALSPTPPIFRSPPAQINPVPVMRSQKPNSRKKNHVKSQSVTSTIYH